MNRVASWLMNGGDRVRVEVVLVAVGSQKGVELDLGRVDGRRDVTRLLVGTQDGVGQVGVDGDDRASRGLDDHPGLVEPPQRHRAGPHVDLADFLPQFCCRLHCPSSALGRRRVELCHGVVPSTRAEPEVVHFVVVFERWDSLARDRLQDHRLWAVQSSPSDR